VVNICSSLLDGLDHPNIIRGLFVHPRYIENETDLWKNELIHKSDILLSIWILVVHMRNEGLFVDLARFCSNIQLADQAGAVGSKLLCLTTDMFVSMEF